MAADCSPPVRLMCLLNTISAAYSEEERQEKALLPYPPMGDFFYAIPAGFIQFVRKQKHF